MSFFLILKRPSKLLAGNKLCKLKHIYTLHTSLTNALQWVCFHCEVERKVQTLDKKEMIIFQRSKSLLTFHFAKWNFEWIFVLLNLNLIKTRRSVDKFQQKKALICPSSTIPSVSASSSDAAAVAMFHLLTGHGSLSAYL